MDLGKSKIVLKSSGNGKYKTTWIYVPSKIAKDSSFPFNLDEEVLIEIKNDALLITKNNKRSRMIKRFGLDNTTLPKLLEKKAIENKDQVFLYYRNEKLSFRDLNERSNQLAWGIIDLVKELNLKNPKITLMMNNCPDFLFSWFSIGKSGCVSVPINTGLRGEYLKHVLNDSDTEILIIDYDFIKFFEEIKNDLPRIKRILVHNVPKSFEFNDEYHDFHLLNRSNIENPKLRIHDEDPIQIFYTEGITGKPKGVLYRNLVRSAINIGFELMKIGSKRDIKVYCPMPLFHGATQFYVIIPSLFYNASVIIVDEFNPITFWEDIRKYNANIFSYFGGYLRRLLNNTPQKFDRNHTIESAYGFGAVPEIWKAFENRFGLRLYECWSHMEGVGVTINTVGSKGRKMGSVGKPLDLCDLKIVDSKRNQLGPGTDKIGEIAVKSRINYILEYYKQPEFTDVRIDDNDGWIYTGDFGYIDNDGFVYFMGKMNQIIYKAGEMIFLREIEAATNSHPSILISACIPIFNDSNPPTELILYAVKMDKSSITSQKLSRFLYHNLAYYHVPRYIEFVDALLMGPSTEYRKNEMRNKWEESVAKKRIWDNRLQDYINSQIANKIRQHDK